MATSAKKKETEKSKVHDLSLQATEREVDVKQEELLSIRGQIEKEDIEE